MTFLRAGAWWGLNRGHPRHPRPSRRINNLAAGGRDLELSHPEGINTVLAKATVEQTKPLTSTH